MKQLLRNLEFPSLTVSQLDLLNAPLTDEEVIKTISSLPLNKAPSTDGPSNNVYKQGAVHIYRELYI